MTNQTEEDGIPLRTVLLFVILVPLIGYLVYFAYQKGTHADERMTECATQCTEKGYLGHSFQWPIFSGPQCTCINE